MTKEPRFSGVYPVMYAFFDGDEKLDRAATKREVDAVINAGVHGVAVMGLGSEVNRLSTPERRALLDWVCEDVNGRAPISVTVAEPSLRGQIEFVDAAAKLGADWVILQPPPVFRAPETELIKFFGAVADRSPIPVGLQNVPEYFGVGLSTASLNVLNRNHPNVSLLKTECSAVALGRLIEETDGAFTVFTGRGAAELTDSLRAGCVGAITGVETCDVVTRIYTAMQSGSEESEAEAERLCRDLAPLMMLFCESIDTFLVYGKYLGAKRLGLGGGAPRQPYTPATPLGLKIIDRYAEELGSLEAPRLGRDTVLAAGLHAR